MLSMVKMLLKGEVGNHALNSHGNYIVDHDSRRNDVSHIVYHGKIMGAQWLSGSVLDLRPRGSGFEPHRHHCIVALEQRHIYPSLVLVQPRKTHPCLTERLLMGRKESNQIMEKSWNYVLEFCGNHVCFSFSDRNRS